MKAALIAGALLTVLASPSSVRACSYGGCGEVAAVAVPAAVGGALVGLASLGVLGMDLTYALRDQPQSTAFAVGNLLLGLVDVAGGVALALALGDTDAFLGTGLAFASAGLLMVIDGIVALAMGPGDPRSRSIGLAVSASPDRVVAGIAGRF